MPSLEVVCHFVSLLSVRLSFLTSPFKLQLLRSEALESSSVMRSDDREGCSLMGRSKPRKGAPMKPARFLRKL